MLRAVSIPFPLTLERARLGARTLLRGAAEMPVSCMLASDGTGPSVRLSKEYCTGLVSYTISSDISRLLLSRLP